MDAKLMQIEFERRLQLISPDITIDQKPTSETIFSVLYEANLRYTRECHMNDDQLPNETRASKRNTDALRTLLVEQELFQNGTTASGLPRFRLPYNANDEYFLYVKSNSKVTGTYKNYITPKVIENSMVKYEDLPKYQSTAFNKPIVREPAVALYSDPNTKYMYLVVAVDDYTNLQSINLIYYRKPMKFNTISGVNILTQCELPESVHDEIVDLAVNIYITELKYRLTARTEE